jgi:hypothetical protein
MLWFLLVARPLVINFDENIKNTLNVCGMSKRSEKKNLNFFIYFVGAIIIDNYLECGWRMKITAVVFDRLMPRSQPNIV